MNSISKNSSILPSLLFVMSIIGIHLGISEYLSVQFIIVIMLTFWLLVIKQVHLRKKIFFNFLILSFFWITITLFKGDTWEILVVLRMLFILFFLTLALSLAYQQENSFSLTIINSVKIAGIIVLSIAIIQYIELNLFGTNNSFLDSKYYSLSYGTIDKDIASNAARAKAFFSEPSSLAAFGLIVAIIGHANKLKSLIIIGVLNIILSSSLAGIICVFIYFFLQQSKNLLQLKINTGWFGFIFLITLILVGNYIFSERLFSVLSGTELSTIIRVVAPISIIQDLFISGEFFGQTRSFIGEKAFYSFGIPHVFDNFILNLIMLNGVFGLILIFALYKLFNNQIGLVLILLSVINGDPLYWDRALFIFLLIFSTGNNFLSSNALNLKRRSASKYLNRQL